MTDSLAVDWPTGPFGGRVGGVKTPPTQPSESAQPSKTASDLNSLVGQWLDWDEASELLHVSTSRVRQLIREHDLAAAVPVEGGRQKVPAELIMDGGVVKGVAGVLTVLHDGNYDDGAAIAWLFTADDSLPGRPIDALRENRGTEVKRRAQALAF